MNALACDAQDQADLFVMTLGDQTLDEAMANLELDARLYGWDRLLVRRTAMRVRAMYARPGERPTSDLLRAQDAPTVRVRALSR